MIRFFLRFCSLSFLAIACIMAVLDASRSIAASAPVTTPLGDAWYSVSPQTLDLARSTILEYALPALWDPVTLWILSLPGFAVFAALSLLFFVIAYKPRRRGFAGSLNAR
ncbi:MAG: hypothetical protein K8H74_01245 [Notoacmeibacter sp.]|nr:hypothetical protein [Notoacmeibacter sp.]